MGSTKRTAITLKTRETLVVRSSPSGRLTWCPACARPSHLLTPEEAAAVCGMSTRLIYRLIEGGGLHFVETGEASVLVCLNSLSSAIG